MFVARKMLMQVAVGCFLAVSGCGIAPPGGGGPDEPPAGRGTVFVLEGDEGSEGLEVITIPSAQQAVAPGDILVGTGGDGYLRRVDSISTQPDGRMSAQTSSTTIAQAAQEGDFAFTDGISNTKRIAQAKRYEVFELSVNLDRTIYSNNGVTVSTSGDFTLDLTIDLEMQVRGARMRYFRSAIEGTADISLDGDIEGLASVSVDRELSLLGSPRRQYLYGVIGGIPVVIAVSADLVAGVSGTMSGSVTLATGVGAESFLRIGAEYDADAADRWSVIADEGLDYGYDTPVWCVQGELGSRVYIRPVVELQLYGVVGPKFDLEPYLEYSAEAFTCGGSGQQPTGAYDWELAAGMSAHTKVKVDILDRFMIESPTLTVFDLRWVLAEGHGTAPATDFDDDGVPDDQDDCPFDPNKSSPGSCGCGNLEVPGCGEEPDSDGDGVPDDEDECPFDANKVSPGTCGCDVSDADSDSDGTADCNDECPNDPNKTSAGNCGCGTPDTPGCGQMTLSFYDGVPSGWTGTADTYLTQGDQTSHGPFETVQVDGTGGGSIPEHGLLKFRDVFGSETYQIPPGSKIVSASLTLTIVTSSTDGGKMYSMLKNWDGSATWDQFDNGIDLPGTEYDPSPDATLDTIAVGVRIIDVTGRVAAWSSGQPNYGWVFLSTSGDGWQFASSEDLAVSRRPRLDVTFVNP